MKKYIFTFFFIVLVIGITNAQTNTLQKSDTIVMSIDTTRASGNEIPVIAISQIVSKPVSFSLSLDTKTWNKFNLSGREKKLIRIGKYDKCFMILETDKEKQAKYVVYNKKSYMITWNNDKKMWELSEEKKE